MKKQLIISHGTLNKDKGTALAAALTRLGVIRTGHDLMNVLSYDTLSGVDEQPQGGAMGALGAENRAIGAIERALADGHADVRYGIGGESWMEIKRGFCIDTATIVIVELTLRPAVVEFKTIAMADSVGIPIPLAHMLTAFEKGVRTTTAGACFEAAADVNGKNWHPTVTHGSLDRRKLLEDAYYAALVQVW